MENFAIRLYPTTELDLEELTKWIIKSDCKRWNIIHRRLEEQDPQGPAPQSFLTTPSPMVSRPPPAPRKTGIYGLQDLPAERTDLGQGEVLYTYSTSGSGHRIFRTGGQVGGPDQMSRKAIYRLLPILSKPRDVYLNTDDFSWILYAANWPVDPNFAESDAPKFLFDTGSVNCHAYYDGSSVGKSPEVESILDTYPGITVLKQDEGIQFNDNTKSRVICYCEGTAYHVDAATLDLHVPGLELSQGNSTMRNVCLEGFDMALNQVVNEETATEDQGTGLDGVLGFGLPTCSPGNRIHEPIYMQVNKQLQREGFARSRQFMVDLTCELTSYERVVLVPTESYLNSIATWTPMINADAIGEGWGITPLEIYLRYNGNLYDLSTQLSENAPERAKIRFVIDTGAVNHYFDPALVQAIQQNIIGARVRRVREPEDKNDEDDEDNKDYEEDPYRILTFPADCMINPPTLVMKFASRAPARFKDLRQIEVPLCQHQADPEGPGVKDPEVPVVAYCLSSQAPVPILGAGRVSVLGSLFFKQYMVHFVPENRLPFEGVVHYVRVGRPTIVATS